MPKQTNIYDLISIFYSLAVGSQGGCGAYDNLLPFGSWTAGIAAVIGFGVQGFTAYYFQGKSIRQSHQDEKKSTLEDSLINSTQVPENIPESKQVCLKNCWEFSRSRLFVTTATVLSFSNYVFIWRNLALLFFPNLPASILWGACVAPGFFIKQCFDLTNETYESVKELTPEGEEVFYKNWLAPCAGNRVLSRKILIWLGSWHHTLVDDFAPWFILFPQIIWSMQSDLKLGIPIAVGLFLFAKLVKAQTNLYEGRHTEKNLKILNTNEPGDSADMSQINPVVISDCQKNIFKRTLLLMGPFHGASIAVPTFMTLFKYVSPTWGISGGSCCFFVGTLGTHLSEVTEAIKEISFGAS